MKLPNWEGSYIPPAKLHDYLLSETHPIGRLKAQLFNSIGYTLDNIEVLEQDLLEIAHTQEIEREIENAYGVKYIVAGNIQTPSLASLQLTTVWIIESGEDAPRFITAYPR